MRIHWFSPLLPDPTDIGHFSGRVLQQLAPLASVTVWTTTANPTRANIPETVAIRRFDVNALEKDAFSRGVVLYNIGNNGPFHSEIFKISQQIPGVVILHEADLQGLFSYIWWQSDSTGTPYVDYLQKKYGSVAGLYARTRLRGIMLDDLAHHYPIVKPAIANALGVISHTSQVTSLARNAGLAVAELNLPYSATDGLSRRERNGRLRLVQFGYLNPHRRIDDVLQAISRHPGRDNIYFQIFGRIWDETYLRRRITALGLTGIVQLMGFVDEAALDDAITECDMALNLRYPTIGEASGTQLRIWRNVAPSMVTDEGWFGELPEGSVLKVKVGAEIEQVTNVVDKLLSDRTHFDDLGTVGNAILRARHDPTDYACALLEFVRQFDR
jgi:glycosyltransferase involved in cell wall biosynthesis